MRTKLKLILSRMLKRIKNVGNYFYSFLSSADTSRDVYNREGFLQSRSSIFSSVLFAWAVLWIANLSTLFFPSTQSSLMIDTSNAAIGCRIGIITAVIGTLWFIHKICQRKCLSAAKPAQIALVYESITFLSMAILFVLLIELDLFESLTSHYQFRLSLSFFALASIITLNLVTIKSLLFSGSKILLVAAQIGYFFARFEVQENGVLRCILPFFCIVIFSEFLRRTSQLELSAHIETLQTEIEKESYQTILERLPEGIMVLDREYSVEYINEPAKRILNCKRYDSQRKIISLRNKDYQKEELPHRSQFGFKRSFSSISPSTRSPKNSRTTDSVKPSQFVRNRNSNPKSQVAVSIEIASLSGLNYSPDSNSKLGQKTKSQRKRRMSYPEPFRGMNLEKLANTSNERKPARNLFGFTDTLKGREPSPKEGSRPQLRHISSIEKNKLLNQDKIQEISTIKDLPHSRDFSDVPTIAEEKRDTHSESLELSDYNEAMAHQAHHYNVGQKEIMDQIIFNLTKTNHPTVKDAIEEMMTRLKNDLVNQTHLLTNCDDSIDALKESVAPPRPIMRRSMRSVTLIDGYAHRNNTSTSNQCLLINTLLKVGEHKYSHLEVKLTPMIIEGEPKIIIMLRDITERDVMRKMKELEDAKTKSLASVVHEFRTPLNSIMSLLESLKVRMNSELYEEYIDPAFYSAKSLLTLTNDILDVAQIKQSKFKLVYQPFCLRKLIQDCMNMISIQARLKGVELLLDYDSKIQEEVVSDPNRLQQIITNLASNSLKFTKKGSIKFVAKLKDTGLISIKVRDTGIGIKSEDQKKLFKTFTKIELGSKDTLNPQGVGLGLAISHSLAQLLNSNSENRGLRVKSVYGKGTKFSFEFEDKHYSGENFFMIDEMNTEDHDHMATNVSQILINEDKKKGDQSHRLGIKEITRIERARTATFIQLNDFAQQKNCDCPLILVVDDDAFNIVALSKQLETLGFKKIATAIDGEQAIEKVVSFSRKDTPCKCRKFEIIFMDCEMPIKNGWQTAKELETLAAEGIIESQLIIGVTGHQSEEIKEKCLAFGMKDVITKPINKEQISNAIFEWSPTLKAYLSSPRKDKKSIA